MSQLESGPTVGVRQPAPPRNVVGAIGFAFSLLGVLILAALTIAYACEVQLVLDQTAWTLIACGALSPLGLLVSVAGVYRVPKTLATVGVVFGLLGSLYLAGTGALLLADEWELFMSAAEKEARSEQRTVDAVRKATEVIQQYVNTRGVAPSDEEGTRMLEGYVDGWGNTIHYLKAPQGDGKQFEVISAGPNQQFGDADDVTNRTLARSSKEDAATPF